MSWKDTPMGKRPPVLVGEAPSRLPETVAHLYVLPHPSGVNRWWNDPANLEAARAFLLRALEGGLT